MDKSSVEMTEVRRRGRPKKIREIDDDVDDQPPPPKRPVGRPKKDKGLSAGDHELDQEVPTIFDLPSREQPAAVLSGSEGTSTVVVASGLSVAQNDQQHPTTLTTATATLADEQPMFTTTVEEVINTTATVNTTQQHHEITKTTLVQVGEVASDNATGEVVNTIDGTSFVLPANLSVSLPAVATGGAAVSLGNAGGAAVSLGTAGGAAVSLGTAGGAAVSLGTAGGTAVSLGTAGGAAVSLGTAGGAAVSLGTAGGAAVSLGSATAGKDILTSGGGTGILKGMQIVGIDGQAISLDTNPIIETDLPVIPMCTLRANAQHPVWFQNELRHALQTGEGYDALWYCAGAVYRVHKFVLAALSDHMKKILPDDESHETASIFTPDLSSSMVKSMLCLIYSGEACVTWKCLQDINQAFKQIGFCGKDLTATPQNATDSVKSNLTISYPDEVEVKPVMTPVKMGGAAGKKRGYNPGSLLTSQTSTFPSLLTPAQLEDQGLIFDNSDQVDMLDPLDTYEDDYGDPDYKPEPNKAIKVELEESEDDLECFDNDGNLIRPRKKIKRETGGGGGGVVVKRRRGRKPKAEIIDEDYFDITGEDDERRRKVRGDDAAWQDKSDTRESKVTYGIAKREKGVLSRKLPFDLFDDQKVAESVRAITVCPVCFKCFDDREKMKEHKTTFHTGQPAQNSMILGKNKFKCRKCAETLELKHLVWFVKHYKFCGADNHKATEVLKVDDVEERQPKEKKEMNDKKNSREVDVVHVLDKPKLKDMSRFMLGKVVDEIWGCRKCYQPFDSEDSLIDHINTAHEGRNEYGTCFDSETRMHSCPNCKVFKTSKSVVYFIYHLSRCNVNEQGAIPIDDEEDVDEDTNEDFVDPWGIVFKPLKVESARSKWMCEAMFGDIFEVLYPCHICYTVFKAEEELREHFRISHPGIQNYPEHGMYFNSQEGAFDCPTCKRTICRKQKNSIYFAYHMLKCTGKTFPVTKSCPACQKSFSIYRNYQYHIQTKCGTTNFVCHICGMVLKNFHGLKCHVMYAHSDVRPYQCKVCTKSFKRSADLDHHMKLHMGSLDWSCEKCGKAFPVKKALKNHMKIHLTEAEKPHVCHICGNRFTRKGFLINHLTTHSSFRGFACEACNAQVKTRDTLLQHRKKVHRLFTPIPESCILQPEEPGPVKLNNSIKQARGGGVKKVVQQVITTQQHIQVQQQQQHQIQVQQHHQLHAVTVPHTLHIKEEVLPMLGEELELS